MVDDGQGNATVGSILETDDLPALTIREDRPLTDVLTLEALGRLGAIIATDEDDTLTRRGHDRSGPAGASDGAGAAGVALAQSDAVGCRNSV